MYLFLIFSLFTTDLISIWRMALHSWNGKVTNLIETPKIICRLTFNMMKTSNSELGLTTLKSSLQYIRLAYHEFEQEIFSLITEHFVKMLCFFWFKFFFRFLNCSAVSKGVILLFSLMTWSMCLASCSLSTLSSEEMVPSQASRSLSNLDTLLLQKTLHISFSWILW